MSTCSIRVQNISTVNVSFFICRYLAAGESSTPVWQASELAPNGMRHFEWDPNDISYAWSSTGSLRSDSTFDIGGTLPTKGTPKVVLDRLSDGSYTLMPSPDGPMPPAGSCIITATGKLREDGVGVGLTLGQNVIAATNIGPNMNVEFMETFRILALVRSDDYPMNVGQMVGPDQLTEAVAIDTGRLANWVVTYEGNGVWATMPA